MTKETSVEFQREFGHYRALAQREPIIITHHGRDDVVLLRAEDYARLRRHEHKEALNRRCASLSDKGVGSTN